MSEQTPQQTISAETAHRLLGELLAARSVMQWLNDNGLLATDQPLEALARQYGGQLRQQREFLDQFEL